MPAFLGLDFGTSGARACAIAADGAVLHEQRIAYPDAERQMPQDWRNALIVLLDGLPPDIASQLAGIAIDGTSATVLLCDDEFVPVSEALLYNDARAAAEADEIARIAPPGNSACSATSGLAKFLWLTRRPGIEAAAHFLHQADWLAALLCGRAVSDWHNALKTGYDVEAQRWPDWIENLSHAHLLPNVTAPGSDIGPLLPAFAGRFGIPTSCRIHAGTTDSTAAFIATGVDEPGIGVTSLGTTLVLKQLSEQRIDAPEFGIYSHRFGDLWLVGGASNAGAGILRKYFDDARLAELSAQIDPTQDSPLDYYPLPRPGERFPVNDPALPPRLDPRPDDDARFLHGLLQGLSRIEAAGYAKLEALGATPLRSVVTNGGGARNETWRNIRERLLGVPIGIAAQSEAAYGAALLARGLPTLSASCASN